MLLCVFCSCERDHCTIIDGTYVGATGDETIEVHACEMRLRVKPRDTGGKNDSLIERQYSYTVLEDGRIDFSAMASTDAVYGVGGFDWYWKEGRIVQQVRFPTEKGKGNVFSRLARK